MQSTHILASLAVAMLLVTLISMFLLRRNSFFKRAFWVSLEIYMAIVGVIVLNLLGEHNPFVIGFLLLIALTTFSITLRALK